MYNNNNGGGNWGGGGKFNKKIEVYINDLIWVPNIF